MSQISVLKRYDRLLNLLEHPYRYPSLEAIIQRFEEDEVPYAERTFRHDVRKLEEAFGISIEYERRKKGYFIQLPEDEDMKEFQTFLDMLKRKFRLDFLSQPHIDMKLGKHLMLEENSNFKGLQFLEVIWDAIRKKRVLTFDYHKFVNDNAPKRRRLAPGLLVEDQNRWYVVGKDLDQNATRMFGLDRFENPQLTAESFEGDPGEKYRMMRPNTLGVWNESTDKVEEIVLRFNALQSNYIKTLPIHPSQQVMESSEEHLVIKLRLVANYELEREILKYGERVEVLAPAHFRARMQARIQAQYALYQPNS